MDASEYIKSVKESMEITQEMIELLEKRIKLANDEIKNKSEYDANELRITIHKTKSEIITLKKVFSEKHRYYNAYSSQFQKDYDEVEEKFSWLMKRAHLNRQGNEKLDKFLSSIDMKAIEENPQTKIYVYKQIREFLKST